MTPEVSRVDDLCTALGCHLKTCPFHHPEIQAVLSYLVERLESNSKPLPPLCQSAINRLIKENHLLYYPLKKWCTLYE